MGILIFNNKKMMLKNFMNRGLHMLVTRPQQVRMIQQGYMINQNNLINAQMRSFAKKKKSSKEAVTTDDEAVEEPVVEEPVAEPVKAAPATPTKAAPPVSDVDFSQAGKAQET